MKSTPPSAAVSDMHWSKKEAEMLGLFSLLAISSASCSFSEYDACLHAPRLSAVDKAKAAVEENARAIAIIFDFMG